MWIESLFIYQSYMKRTATFLSTGFEQSQYAWQMIVCRHPYHSSRVGNSHMDVSKFVSHQCQPSWGVAIGCILFSKQCKLNFECLKKNGSLYLWVLCTIWGCISLLLQDCPSCLAHLNSIGWVTWAVWAAIKKYALKMEGSRWEIEGYIS